MSTDQLVQIVALVMCLLLAWRSVKSERLAGRAGLKMAIAWALIIAALALGIRLFGV